MRRAPHPWNMANFLRSSSHFWADALLHCSHLEICAFHHIYHFVLTKSKNLGFQLNELGPPSASLLILKHSIVLGFCACLRTVYVQWNSWKNKAQITSYITLHIYSGGGSNTFQVCFLLFFLFFIVSVCKRTKSRSQPICQPFIFQKLRWARDGGKFLIKQATDTWDLIMTHRLCYNSM